MSMKCFISPDIPRLQSPWSFIVPYREPDESLEPDKSVCTDDKHRDAKGNSDHTEDR